jgi:hypothetical protein
MDFILSSLPRRKLTGNQAVQAGSAQAGSVGGRERYHPSSEHGGLRRNGPRFVDPIPWQIFSPRRRRQHVQD